MDDDTELDNIADEAETPRESWEELRMMMHRTEGLMMEMKHHRSHGKSCG